MSITILKNMWDIISGLVPLPGIFLSPGIRFIHGFRFSKAKYS